MRVCVCVRVRACRNYNVQQIKKVLLNLTIFFFLRYQPQILIFLSSACFIKHIFDIKMCSLVIFINLNLYKIFPQTHTHTHTCTDTHTHVHAHTHVHGHTHTLLQTHTHTRTLSQTHTHKLIKYDRRKLTK